MEEQVKANLSALDTWVRLLFMVLFGIVATIALNVLLVAAAAQFLFCVFTTKPNVNLDAASGSLVDYIGQILNYLVFRTDAKPFPFGDWPEGKAASVYQLAHKRAEPKEAADSDEPEEAPAK